MLTSVVLVSILLLDLFVAIEQPTINIRINEELPLSTILFTVNANSTYRLFDSARNHNSFVHYNVSTGDLQLARSLDREHLCAQHVCSCVRCQLLIELIQWQSPYHLLKLWLVIDDINDNSPAFSSSTYRLALMENVPIGFELPLEQANDVDFGDNARLTYELRSLTERGPFELMTKENGGLAMKITGAIDREQRDSYVYQLTAYDHGQPRRSTSTRLTIQIEVSLLLPVRFCSNIDHVLLVIGCER
jgi:hypothetical protein